MSFSRQNAVELAKKFLRVDHLPKMLGSGAEGFVFSTPRASAIKVFFDEGHFWTEVNIYKRLKQRKIYSSQGVAIPTPIRYSSSLQIIEMSIVQPPFLVDFSQA